jgi:hypothetical protein
MVIKIDRLSAFKSLRKGPRGQGKGGTFTFRDKTKYSRKGRNVKDW